MSLLYDKLLSGLMGGYGAGGYGAGGGDDSKSMGFLDQPGGRRAATMAALGLLRAGQPMPPGADRLQYVQSGLESGFQEIDRAQRYAMEKARFDMQQEEAQQKIKERERQRFLEEERLDFFGQSPGVTGGPVTTPYGALDQKQLQQQLMRLYPKQAGAEFIRQTFKESEDPEIEIRQISLPGNKIQDAVYINNEFVRNQGASYDRYAPKAKEDTRTTLEINTDLVYRIMSKNDPKYTIKDAMRFAKSTNQKTIQQVWTETYNNALKAAYGRKDRARAAADEVIKSIYSPEAVKRLIRYRQVP